MITVKIDTSKLDLPKLIENLQANMDTTIRTVATSMLGVVKTRIHEEGKAADGSTIGQYDTTHPLYVNPKNSPKAFSPAGKGEVVGGKKGRSITVKMTSTKYVNKDSYEKISTTKNKRIQVLGKHGERQRKTRYFPSYKDFREYIGRPVDKVNLSLSGQLNNQFVVIATDKGYGLGWNNDEMPERAAGLTTKYGKEIWALTEEEQTKAVEIAQETINKLW